VCTRLVRDDEYVVRNMMYYSGLHEDMDTRADTGVFYRAAVVFCLLNQKVGSAGAFPL
jgi:hypothetical protein